MLRTYSFGFFLFLLFGCQTGGEELIEPDDEAFAKEVSKFLSFRLFNDTLQIGSCPVEVYLYEQKSNSSRYDGESAFLGFYRPKTEQVPFITIIGNSRETCFPFDNLLFYHPSEEELVFFDRGYFFEFEPAEELPLPSYIRNWTAFPAITGRIGPWSLRQMVSQITQKRLTFSKKNFPMGVKIWTRNGKIMCKKTTSIT